MLIVPIRTVGVAPIDQRENRHIADRVFRWVEDEPVMCVAQSEDLHWVFFGMDWREPWCDLMSECTHCWPLCAWCWYDCTEDGECRRDDCETHEHWAATAAARVSGPPWFTLPYRELRQAIKDTPWRPQSLIRWRPPLRPSIGDNVLYYPEALATCRGRSMRDVWRSLAFLSLSGARPRL